MRGYCNRLLSVRTAISVVVSVFGLQTSDMSSHAQGSNEIQDGNNPYDPILRF
jgi:hypothetical protein